MLTALRPAALALVATLALAPRLASSSPAPSPPEAPELLEHDDPAARRGDLVGVRGYDPGWRDSRVAERAPNLWGQTGLLRITSARPGKHGYFDLALHGLVSRSGDFLLPGTDPNTLVTGVPVFGLSLLDRFELSVATRSASNENELDAPPTSVSTGELIVSGKAAHAFSELLVAGVDLRVTVPSPEEQVGLSAENAAVSALALFTVDAYEAGVAPLRVHVNAGYVLQNAKNLGDVSIFYPTLDSHLIGLATQQWYYDHVDYGLGVEGPLPYAAPFLELWGQTALGAPPGGGGATSLTATPGVRVAIGRGLAADLGLDVGLLGLEPLDGRPVNLPWALHGGLSYTFSPFVAETMVEVRETARPTGRIAGCVTSAADGSRVAEAYVEFVGRPGPRIVVGDDGCYESPEMEVAALTVRIRHPDFAPGEQAISLKAGEVTRGDVALTPAPRLGAVRGTITNEKDERVPAELSLRSAGGKLLRVKAEDGSFLAEVPPGKYQVLVEAGGYLNQGKRIVVEPLGQTLLDFLLKEIPRKRGAAIAGKKIEIKTMIPFEYGKSRLLRAASFILDDVVDVILRNPALGKIRVEGHSDASGVAQLNSALADGRAKAVQEYLLQAGVPPERLEASGFGSSRPIATNDTEEGRARNRRVEFVIVGDGDDGADGAEGR